MKRLLPMLLLTALPAQAQSPRDAIFASDGACYLRHYDRAHLSAHPDQIVTEIAVGPYAPEWGHQRFVVITVMVSVRGLTENFLANAYCENESDHLFCGMEGDAGSFTLTPRKGGKVLLRLTRNGMAFEGQSGFVSFSGVTGDDREFLLPPVPADSCP